MRRSSLPRFHSLAPRRPRPVFDATVTAAAPPARPSGDGSPRRARRVVGPCPSTVDAGDGAVDGGGDGCYCGGGGGGGGGGGCGGGGGGCCCDDRPLPARALQYRNDASWSKPRDCRPDFPPAIRGPRSALRYPHPRHPILLSPPVERTRTDGAVGRVGDGRCADGGGSAAAADAVGGDGGAAAGGGGDGGGGAIADAAVVGDDGGGEVERSVAAVAATAAPPASRNRRLNRRPRTSLDRDNPLTTR